MQKRNKNDNSHQDTGNIFDEFSISQDLSKEIQDIKKSEEKNIYYYLQRGIKIFFVGNLTLLLICIVLFGYTYLQKRELGSIPTILSPICSLFLGDIPIEKENCKNISSLHFQYTNSLEEETSFQAEEILSLLDDVYAIENFHVSPRVKFLNNMSQNRGKVLDLLSAFDEIKTEFSPTDKKEFSCYNISITNKNILELRCDFFSSDWDTGINTFEGGNGVNSLYGGTSISRASSFIHFLENDEKNRFVVLDSPDSFRFENIQDGPYTKKTSVQLQLLYQGYSPSFF